MATQTERALTRARERFAVQDYYGTVHLLEEIIATGRAFADVHHLLGVSLSLLGQRERALAELGRALELNPRYLEALIHQGLVLSEMGREAEAEDAFRRAASSVSPPAGGLPSPVAALVYRGTIEGEYRGAQHWGLAQQSPDEEADALRQSHEVEIQYGITDFWAVRLTPNVEQPEGESTELNSIGYWALVTQRRPPGRSRSASSRIAVSNRPKG